MIVNFLIFPAITLHESALIVSPSLIIAEKANFKEEEFTYLWHKAAKKVSMLTVYSKD